MKGQLEKQLDEKQVAVRSQIPSEALSQIDEATDSLISSKIVDSSLQVGDTVPNFSLPNQNGKTINLKELLEKGSLVISFYRGGWCPYCNLELMAIQSVLDEIKGAGANLIAITPETADSSLSTTEKNNLKFEVLFDQGNEVAKEFGLEFVLPKSIQDIYKNFGIDLIKYNGDDSFTLPVPATYVINQEGKIVYQFAHADYTKRAKPSP